MKLKTNEITFILNIKNYPTAFGTEIEKRNVTFDTLRLSSPKLL